MFAEVVMQTSVNKNGYMVSDSLQVEVDSEFSGSHKCNSNFWLSCLRSYSNSQHLLGA